MTGELTRRERRLYSAISAAAAVVWVAALLGYFVLSDRAHHVTLLEICFFAVNTVLMFGFGYALRSNLRVIRGVHWLEAESHVSEHQ
jgi:hypothetical protein